MKGLDVCRAYFEEYGRIFLDSCGEKAGRLACALTGSGSECMGYDDSVSRDHDFDPGFLVLLPGEEDVSSREEFSICRAYDALPDEFMGLSRSRPQLRGRRGVLRAAEFFADRTGTPDGGMSLDAWCFVPSYAVGEAVNGEVFYDPSGFFTRAREKLAHMPEDARRKRLAGQLALMSQAGEYNYPRTLAHGERQAAQLALYRFCESAAACAFLAADRYMPYYKWWMRALREIEGMEELPEMLDFLLTNDNMEETVPIKREVMENVMQLVLGAVRRSGLSRGEGPGLQDAASDVNEGIRDAALRGRSLLYAV